MSFSIHAELEYEVHERSTLLVNVHALRTPTQQLRNESFTLPEGAQSDIFPLPAGKNRYVRIDTGELESLLVTYDVEADTHFDSLIISGIDQVPVTGIDVDALPFLFPSRYCQSDRLGRFAAKHFGHIDHPLAQAAAISDWIYENTDYIPGSSDPNTSACDTLVQRAGVCRDFAHLGIALCRALSIPARYTAGYACDMEPQDFHACFEVCVDNRWFVHDPTRLAALDGLVRIGIGRDAADVSVATIFGAVSLRTMSVNCTSPDFVPTPYEQLRGKAVTLDP